LLAAAQNSEIGATNADQVVSIWDLAKRSVLRELRLPSSIGDSILEPSVAFTCIAFSPNSASILAGDYGGNVVVWRVADGVALRAFNAGSRTVADVAFSPDGTSIAAASEGWVSEAGSIWLWKNANGSDHQQFSTDDNAAAKRIAFSHTGSQILMGLADGRLLRWNIADAALVQELPGHSDSITALAYTSDGTGLLSAASDGSLRTWRANGTPVATLASLGTISAITVSPDGTLVISGDAGGAIDIRHRDGTLITHIASKGGKITALAINPNNTLLAAAGYDGIVRLWKLPVGEPSGELASEISGTYFVAFSPDGTLLATAGHDGNLRLWRIPGATEERNVMVEEMSPSSHVNTTLSAVAFSPDGAMIAVAGQEGVSLWHSADLTLIKRNITDAFAAFTPNGDLITSAGDGQISILDGTNAASVGFAFLPNGSFATLSDTTLCIWNGPIKALQRSAEATASGFTSLAVGPKTIAIGSQLGTIEVWAVQP
jgi:WD40 repeat protein